MVKRQRSSSTPPSTVDDEKFTSGDMFVISSDNIRFKVPSHVLISASPALASLIAVLSSNGEPKVLNMTDKEIECATTIRLFLSIVSLSGTFKLLDSLPSGLLGLAREMRRLVFFMDKYRSETAVAQLRLHESHEFLHSQASPAWLFVLASTTNNLAVCFLILDKFKGWTRSASDDASLVGSRTHNSVFSPSHAKLEYACSLPFEYHWALARAASYGSQVKTDSISFCHKFVEIVQAVLGQSSCKLRISYAELTSGVHLQGPSFPPIIAKPNLEGYKKP